VQLPPFVERRMALTIVTEPTIEPLTLAEIKEHLRLEAGWSVEDSVITFCQKAARRYCEQFQGRAYMEQTWKLTLDAFPRGGVIEIPRPPLLSVTHVKYYGTGGTATTMTAANYYVDTASERGRVHLGYGEVWPGATLRPAAGVEVQFVAGYGSATSSVPDEIKQAINMLAAHLYENREATTPAGSIQARELPFGVQSLLGLDRVIPI